MIFYARISKDRLAVEAEVPDPAFMLEYLQRVGVEVKSFTDNNTLKAEYLRHIYRVDARDKLIDHKGKPMGKPSNPRHIHYSH